jgi:hypothetical protein
METSISLEERKREEEMKRVKMKMSLAEVRLELQKLETKLSELKTQKHLLFSQLKKVLNEDVIRRRNRDLQWSADALYAAAELPPPAPPLGLPFAPPFAPNAFFRAQTSQPQYKPTFAATKAPPVVRKRSHEQTTTPTTTTGRQPHDERDYKSVTYTPQMGSEYNKSAANTNANDWCVV